MDFEKEYNSLLLEYERLQANFNSINDKYTALNTKLDTEAINEALNDALDKADFTTSKVRGIVLGNIDKSTLKVEDGAVKGIDEIVASMKEQYSEFFNITHISGNEAMTPPQQVNSTSKPQEIGFFDVD